MGARLVFVDGSTEELSMTQLAKLLGLGITDTAIEKWEKNQNRPTESHRCRLIEFLRFDPAAPELTGGF